MSVRLPVGGAILVGLRQLFLSATLPKEIRIYRRLLHGSAACFLSDDGKVMNHNIEKSPITMQLWNERLKLRASISNFAEKTPQTQLLDKTVADSRLSVRYNFTKDSNLRDAYVDCEGHVLTGKLLEDLDALAGNVAFMHCDDNNPTTRPPSLVTASVDRIRETRPISASGNIVLVGQVAWVGKSSLDILMEIHSVNEPGSLDGPTMIREVSDTRLLTAIFTYVARDRTTGKACQVNRLTPSGEDEVALFERRGALALARKAKATPSPPSTATTTTTTKTTSPAAAPPAPAAAPAAPAGVTPAPNTDINALLERGHALDDMPALTHHNAILMKHTGLENCLLCQPQNTNTSGKVFGGFLMHRAFSLAEATSYLFAGSRPRLLEVDRIEFTKPVDISDLIRLKSRVLYSSSNTSGDEHCSFPATGATQQDKVVLVEVVCHVVKPEKATSFLSNKFRFVFQFPDGGASLKRVLPVTIEEGNALIKAAHWDDQHA
jgi:acyl-coenzyme A thioesterase 9